MIRMLLRRTVLAVAALTLASGCAPAGPNWPAVAETPTDVRVQGRWIWAELFADNVDAEKTFYSAVFGWTFVTQGTATNGYTVVRANDRPIAGIIHFPKPEGASRSARWLPIMSVPKPSAAAGDVAHACGKVVVPPRSFPGRGEAAVFADPEGALFGVIRTETGDPPDALPAEHAWFWLELWSKNAARMAEFYRPIGGYEVVRQEGTGDRPELHLVSGGYPRAAVLELERKDLPSTWLPYIRVKDVKKAAADIELAGGRIVVEPGPDIRNGKVAVFLDPLGAAAAIVEWADGDEGEARQ